MATQLSLPGIGSSAAYAAIAEKIVEQNGLAAAIAALLGVTEISEIVSNPHNAFRSIPQDLVKYIPEILQAAEKAVGTVIADATINQGLGFNVSDQSGEAAQAMRIVERAIGFTALLPLIMGPIAGALEARLGNHAPKSLLDSLRSVPQELGLNFFLGNVLSEIFESASSTPIREAISYQTRPARLEYREIRALLKGHVLTDAEAEDRLAHAGYRQGDIDKLKQLDRVFLNSGELMNEFIHGRLSESDLDDYLDMIGYIPVDKGRLKQQWVENAQAGGAGVFRSVMRRGVLEGHIAQSQYISALQSLHVPQDSIDLDVKALQLELDWGRIRLSVGQIKQFFQKGEFSDTQAVSELVSTGYDDSTANALITDWTTEAKKTKAGIGIPRILSYLLSNVINKADALSMLTQMGLSINLATLLINNPSQYGGLIRHPQSPSTYVSAFKDDVITYDQLVAGLKAIGTDPKEADLLARTANAQKTRSLKPRQPVKHLSDGQIIDAYKYGLATAAWAVREMVTNGYTEGDAQVIITTEETKLSTKVPDSWTQLT